MLAKTLSVAFARGNSDAMTSSSLIHEVLVRSPVSANTASRRRTTIRAANMSPVPLKKQSMAGICTRNTRGIGLVREVTVDPMTDNEGPAPGLGNETEVMMICGMR